MKISQLKNTKLFKKIGKKYSTNSLDKPKIKFIVNTKYVEYYETYYGGNPTLYQDMFIGHSTSGFTPFEDYDFFLQIENAETDAEGFLDLEKLSTENRKKIENFRKNNIYNTVGFSNETEFNTNFNLKTGCVNSNFALSGEHKKAINIGPGYFLTRVVN